MPNLGRFTWFARHFSLASRNGHLSSTVQTDAILLAKHCWMLHVSSACSPCVACAWLLLGIDAQSLSLVTLVATCKRTQQFQTLLSQKTLGVVCISVGSGVQTDATFPNDNVGTCTAFWEEYNT